MINSIISFKIITFYLFCHLALSAEAPIPTTGNNEESAEGFFSFETEFGLGAAGFDFSVFAISMGRYFFELVIRGYQECE